MKRFRLLIVISLLIFLLTSCLPTNRFADNDMDYYANEYNIVNIIFQEKSSLDYLGYELYISGYFISVNNEYNNETESMDWALGEIDGKAKILFVPLNSNYDIYVLDSPFPNFEDVRTQVDDFNEFASSSVNIELSANLVNYEEFKSLVYLQLISNDFFTYKELDSSFSAKIGTCLINEEEYTVRLVSYNNGVVVIAHSNLDSTELNEINVIEIMHIQ